MEYKPSFADQLDIDYIAHHGVKGMKWGVRRYRNYDGSVTSAGKAHVNAINNKSAKQSSDNKPKGMSDKTKKRLTTAAKIAGAAAAVGVAGHVAKVAGEEYGELADTRKANDLAKGVVDKYYKNHDEATRKYIQESVAKKNKEALSQHRIDSARIKRAKIKDAVSAYASVGDKGRVKRQNFRKNNQEGYYSTSDNIKSTHVQSDAKGQYTSTHRRTAGGHRIYDKDTMDRASLRAFGREAMYKTNRKEAQRRDANAQKRQDKLRAEHEARVKREAKERERRRAEQIRKSQEKIARERAARRAAGWQNVA